MAQYGPSGAHAYNRGPEARETLEQRIRPHEIRDADFFDVPELLRQALGKLVGAPSDDIVLGNSTNWGIDLLANGIRWEAGDEICALKGDFPADLTPWSVLKQRGVTLRLIEPDGPSITAEALDRALSRKTRLFCTSWVNSFTGFAADVASLGRICHDRGVLFVLTASQALGARVLDIGALSVDAVTSCGYKWLCGPYGTGFCWLRPALRESLCPLHAYWLTMQKGKPLDHMRESTSTHDLGARAWDVFGTANFLNFVPWTACIQFLLEAGPERVASCDEAFVDKLVRSIDRQKFELVSPEDGTARSILVVLRPHPPQNGLQLQQRLDSAGIDVALREGNLRISPHVHNTIDDFDRLIAVLNS